MARAYRLPALLVACLLALSLVALPDATRAQDRLAGVDEPVAVTASAALRNYASLPKLISMICDDAVRQFDDFFGSTLVRVEPFPFLWEFKRQRPSMLGITLADQMAAVLNCHTRIGAWSQRDQYATPDPNESPMQWVQGTIQEIDGYLRVHIIGSNAKGVRKSYVVNAEMSEPIYRALHTLPVQSRLHAGIPDPG